MSKLLKESMKAQEALSLKELQAMRDSAMARLRVLESEGSSAGLGAEYLQRARGHLERIAHRISSKKKTQRAKVVGG